MKKEKKWITKISKKSQGHKRSISNDIADYKIVEFNPTKYHINFINFINP